MLYNPFSVRYCSPNQYTKIKLLLKISLALRRPTVMRLSVLPALGRWRRRTAATESVCSGRRLSVMGELKRKDVVKLLTIYNDDMSAFGYTWNEKMLTAKCRTDVLKSLKLLSHSANATDSYCC